MNGEYQFKSTGIIKEALMENKIKHVAIINKDEDEITEVVRALIPIGSEGDISVDFTSFGNDIVCIEIKDLLTGISNFKKENAIEACNCLNARYRVLKFFFYEGNINLYYDLPKYLSKNDLKKNAIDYLKRIETLWTRIRHDIVKKIDPIVEDVEIDDDSLPL